MSQNATAKPAVNHRLGIIIATLGVLSLSFDAVFIRLAEASAATAAGWRGIFIAVALGLYLLFTGQLRDFARLRSFRWVALLVCGIYGFNAAAFVFAVSYTTVANTVIILCCTPFFAATFSWLILRETIDKVTWLTIVVAVLGVVVVFLGAETSSSLVGNFLALALSASTGFMLTYLRRYPGFPRIPAVSVGALLSAIILLPMATPFDVSPSSLAWLAITGCLLKPLASVCMLVATRYIPSPEVSVFMLLETLLAPILAWFILGEAIVDNTLIGGAVVLLVVVFHCFWALKHDR